MIRAVLTIDDIPSANTPAIVDCLNGQGIQAVLFAEGQRLDRFREEAVYALRHGMILGNHSDTHPSFSGLTADEAVREIDACEEKLGRVYREAGVRRTARPFRFPYGDKGGTRKAEFQRILAEKGFSRLKDTRITFPWWRENGLDRDIDTFWTFDFAEYRIRPGSSFTLEDVWKRVADPRPASGASLTVDPAGHILLMHAHDETEAMVPGYCGLFIARLLQMGVVFDRPEF